MRWIIAFGLLALASPAAAQEEQMRSWMACVREATPRFAAMESEPSDIVADAVRGACRSEEDAVIDSVVGVINVSHEYERRAEWREYFRVTTIMFVLMAREDRAED